MFYKAGRSAIQPDVRPALNTAITETQVIPDGARPAIREHPASHPKMCEGLKIDMNDTSLFACMFYVDVIRSVADVTLADTDCTTTWSRYLRNYFGRYGIQHSTTTTWRQCSEACEFDPSCVAFDWQWSLHECWINTDPKHHHDYRNDQWSRYARHYDLVRRCNVTTGQYLHELIAF